MPTSIIRPNGTYDTSGWAIVGAATEHAALSDQSDASYIDYNSSGSVQSGLDFGTFSLPAGAVVSRWRFGVRYRDGEVSGIVGHATAHRDGLYASTIFTASTAPNNGGFTSENGPWNVQYISQAEIDAWRVYGGSTAAIDFAELWTEFEYALAPSAPTVNAPTGTQTTTRKPTVGWTFNAGTDGGGQSKFQVKIFSDAQYGAGGFDPETSGSTLSSGTVTSGTSSWTPTSNLPNGDTYRAYVKTAATTNGVDQWSAWAYVQFSIALALTAPTSLVPTNASTETTAQPALGASIATQPSSVLIKREWQVASDTGFTTNLQTYSDSTLTTTKSGTITFPAGWTTLAQGTWYVRCRTVDEYGEVSAWTATNTFTVAHVPSTGNRQPSGGISVNYGAGTVNLSWSFTDPYVSDVQTAYEVEFWLASAGQGTATSSGKVSSASTTYAATIPVGWKDQEVRWRVRVYDVDDVVSAWSIDQAFVPRDLPTANITAPVGALSATSSQPTVTWSFTASGGRTQASYRVVVTDTDASQVVADSGVVSSAATSWQVPTPVIVIATNYQIDIYLVDNVGLQGTDTDTFTATYSAPTTPTFYLQGADFTEYGKVLVDWSSATQDPTCLGWNVYRRLAGNTQWTLIYATDVPGEDLYEDYTCPANVDVEYSVTQMAESLGDPVESAYPIEAFQGYADKYLLVVPENPALNLTLYHVTGDTFADEHEVAEINLIGRGRQVAYGTRFGQRGSLSGTFRDQPQMTGRTQRLYLEAIRSAGLKTYLRNPFGDVWAVALSSASVTRVAGVGLHAMATYTIEYAEVTA